MQNDLFKTDDQGASSLLRSGSGRPDVAAAPLAEEAGSGGAGGVHHIISLGAGVQSSTMALMAARGEITPMPTAAIFADTKAEPKLVYDWLDWLEKQLPFPVHRVEYGNLLTDTLSERPKGKFLRVDIPAFIVSNGKVDGLINRSCTRDYKIKPIQRKLRDILGFKKGARIKGGVRVIQWIGISLDEVHRMKPSREAWIENRWPLIDARMNRHNCLLWMQRNGYPQPPKSSCMFCPYHSNNQWLALPEEEREICCTLDDKLRSFTGTGKVRLKGELFLHKSGKPLREFYAEKAEGDDEDLFGNECSGVCNS